MTENALAVRTETSKELEDWKKRGANVLLPSTQIQGLSEWHMPILEAVQLSTNPEDGDVYAHDNAKDGAKKKWRPTKQALMKLSVCAGVIWSVSESKRIDDGKNRDYVCYRAVGGIRKADGQPVFFSAEYDLDFEVIEEELRENYEQKVKGDWAKDKTKEQKADYVEYCVKRDLLQKRKNKLKLCEAGAMNRVLRMLLGLKQAYTAEELHKPFVTMRVVFRPDFSDKEVRAKFIDASVAAMTGIYGPQAIEAGITRPDQAQPIDVTPLTEVNEILEAEELPPEPFDPPSQNPMIDFQNSDDFGQCKALTDLAGRKGYNLADYQNRANKTIAEMERVKREAIFVHLMGIPDKQQDDIPL